MNEDLDQIFARAVLMDEVFPMNKPAITVIIPTFNRVSVVDQTVAQILGNLRYDGRIHVIIGDDATDPKQRVPRDLYGSANWVDILTGPSSGLGANLNMLIENVKTDIVLQMDDDHWLVEPLDINHYVDDLRNPEMSIGWIRLFMGETEDLYSLKTYYKFRGFNYGPYWYPEPESPELYIASNRPHLKLVDMHKKYIGWYPENKTLGKTEEAFSHMYKNKRKAAGFFSEIPWVVIPMLGLKYDQWRHVGDSWQKKGF